MKCDDKGTGGSKVSMCVFVLEQGRMPATYIHALVRKLCD
jgi:hypothetical protein